MRALQAIHGRERHSVLIGIVLVSLLKRRLAIRRVEGQILRTRYDETPAHAQLQRYTLIVLWRHIFADYVVGSVLVRMEAALWTEWISDKEKFDMCLYPRMAVLAEACWSGYAFAALQLSAAVYGRIDDLNRAHGCFLPPRSCRDKR